jgi:hypothetical protein
MALNTAGQTRTPTSEIYVDGMAKFAAGSVVFDATSITAGDYININVGFVPKYFVFHNDTDRIMVEWRQGMAQDSCIKTAANGTRTLETTNKGVTVGVLNSDTALTSAGSGTIPLQGQVQVSQNATLAVIAASKTCRWSAWG